ncbi:MAG: pimeloyl-ACP methyl ester carboxylesterase [Alphaproteobacteria bacterium]|jgi:pimeloyl-ACP methyl ester carboxylesterase
MTHDATNDTACDAEGIGPPVLLIHGMGLNRYMWRGQVPHLTPKFQTIRYDLLGHGDSVKRPGSYVMPDFVDQAIRLLDDLRLEQCALVGFSLGGMIGRAIAIAHPDRISALAILNSPHDRTDAERAALLSRLDQALDGGPLATVDAALKRWFTDDYAHQHPEVLNQVRNWMNANDPDVYAEIYRLLATGDAALADSIRTIKCPVLALACAEDHGNSPNMARKMAALIPNARATIIPHLKHMGLVENPTAINAAILPFLEEALS